MPSPVLAPDAALRAPQFAGSVYSGENKRLLWCVVVALVLHQPLVASGLFGWLRFMFRDRIEDVAPPVDEDTIISVDLDGDLFGDGPAGAEPGAAGATPPPAPLTVGAGHAGDPLILDGGIADDDDDDDDADDDNADAGAPSRDAGAPSPVASGSADAGTKPSDAGAPVADAGPIEVDAGVELPDAGAPLVDAGLPPVAVPGLDAGAVPVATDAGVEDIYDDDDPPDAAAPDAGLPVPAAPEVGPKVGDPTSLAKGANVGASKYPNVRLYINAKKVRAHPLGKNLGPLLNAVPEWKELLGGTGIDPVRDFDHLFIEGPQLRNPRHIITHIYYNVSDKRMRGAIDKVVKRSGKDGRWLEGQPLPLAAIGRRGYRRVALMPKFHKFVVLPAGEEKQVEHMAKATKPLKKMRRPVMLLALKHAARALRGVFPLPRSIKTVKLRLTGDGGDGFFVDIDAQDASAEKAAESLKVIRVNMQDIRKVPSIDFLFGKKYFFGEPVFRLDGNTIHVRATVSRRQVERLLDVAELAVMGLGDKKGAGKRRLRH